MRNQISDIYLGIEPSRLVGIGAKTDQKAESLTRQKSGLRTRGKV